MKILVRSPNWIGDQVLAYPFFHFLRRAYPRARIVAVCSPWVESVQFRNLVDDVIVLPRLEGTGAGDRFRGVERAAALIRAAGPWDSGYSLPNSFSAAWQLFRGGVRERIGYVGDGRSLLLTRRVRHAETGDRADSYLRLLPAEFQPNRPSAEFWGVPPENELDPGVPGVLARFDAERAWPDVSLVEPPAEPYWILAPGSVAESRRWPVERYVALARTVADRTGLSGVVVGGRSETRLAEALCEDRSLKLSDRTNQGPVAGLWKLFRNARFTVSNDSGLAHVAALCGSSVQIVWGAGNPKKTRPLGPGKVRLLFNPVECWPCEKNSCLQQPGRKLECLSGISADGVWEELSTGLFKKGPAA